MCGRHNHRKYSVPWNVHLIVTRKWKDGPLPHILLGHSVNTWDPLLGLSSYTFLCFPISSSWGPGVARLTSDLGSLDKKYRLSEATQSKERRKCWCVAASAQGCLSAVCNLAVGSFQKFISGLRIKMSITRNITWNRFPHPSLQTEPT